MHQVLSVRPSTQSSIASNARNCQELRVQSCIALPSTDLMPIRPTQVYQKGDQISAVSSSLWTLSLSIPLGKSALLFCVSSYHSADSVSPLICNTFCFLCKKKKKKKKEMFCFLPCESSYAVYLLAFSFSLYCTVTPFCKMVLIADWAPVFWLLCTPITCFFICNASGVKTWLPWIPQTLASWRQIGSV